MTKNRQKSTSQKTRTIARQEAFLTSFAEHGIVTKACITAEIDRSTIYLWKEHDESFLLRYNRALEEAKDNIKEEVYRRGKEGWEEDVYQLGKYAGTIRKYSDTLLIFHAKMLMPEYREKQQVDVNTHSVQQDVHALHDAVAQALADYPDARIAVAAALAQGKK